MLQNTFLSKLRYSLVPALLFTALSLPFTYNKISEALNTSNNSCPTPASRLAHAGVFLLLNYGFLKYCVSVGWMKKKSDSQLFKCAFTGTLLFLVLASSDTYKLTTQVTSRDVFANQEGCPTDRGVCLHGVVYLVVLALMMHFLPESK